MLQRAVQGFDQAAALAEVDDEGEAGHRFERYRSSSGTPVSSTALAQEVRLAEAELDLATETSSKHNRFHLAVAEGRPAGEGLQQF